MDNVKNAIIKEAMKLNINEDEVEERGNADEKTFQIFLNMKKTPLLNQF